MLYAKLYKKIGCFFITSLLVYFLLTYRNAELFYNFFWKTNPLVWICFSPNYSSKGTWIPLQKAGLNLRFSVHVCTHLLIFQENVFKEALKENIDGVFQSPRVRGELIHSTKIAFARNSYFANIGYIPSVSQRWLLHTEEKLSILLQCRTWVTYWSGLKRELIGENNKKHDLMVYTSIWYTTSVQTNTCHCHVLVLRFNPNW